jgi:uncharacterized protein YkwD
MLHYIGAPIFIFDRRSYLIAFLLALPALAAGAAGGAERGAPDPGEVAVLVVTLTNEFRAREKRGKVAVSGRLAAAARDFAGYMAKSGQFSHEAGGTTPVTRAKQHGYDHCIVLENIAYRYSSTGFATRELAQGMVEGWEKSPGHRRNMVDPDVTEIGVGVARGKPGHYYAVQLFGRPAAQAMKFRIANQANASIRYRIGGTSFSLGPRQVRAHTQCRTEKLEFDWPGERRDAAVTPKNGDRYTVVRSGSGFTLKTE